jgi:hypothetical protein
MRLCYLGAVFLSIIGLCCLYEWQAPTGRSDCTRTILCYDHAMHMQFPSACSFQGRMGNASANLYRRLSVTT